MPILRINAWSSPRNISTALMYAFAQRKDTTVVDEPLYAHYLSHTTTEALHPGREEILQSQDWDGEKVVERVIMAPYPTPVVFFKQMTHHLIELDRSFLAETANILLIRDPRAIIASYAKVVHNPSIHDIGVAMQETLFRQLRELGTLKAVIDARELLLNPPQILRQLCAALNLPFDENMLHWPAEARPEDGVWAPYWYSKIHRSTGFLPYQEETIELPPRLEDLAETCRPYYRKLYKFALKATTPTH